MTAFGQLASRYPALNWLGDPRKATSLWLGKHCALIAWAGLLLAGFSSPQGVGLPLCWFQSATGVPCPGCGLTRSLSCGLHGMFWESFHFHPLGLPILALFIFIVMQGFLPRDWRSRIVRFMQARALFFNSLYLAFVISFTGFGALRALHHVMMHW